MNMHTVRSTQSLYLAVAILAAFPVVAQEKPDLPQPSPMSRVEQRVGVTDFAVEYSSPAVNGRTIWGDLVPYDELWRTGANAATTLEASQDFRFGGVDVPAGTYAHPQREHQGIRNPRLRQSPRRRARNGQTRASRKPRAHDLPVRGHHR